MSKAKYGRCLVLDQNYMAKSIIATDRAFVIFYKGNADIVHEHPVTFGLVKPELEIFKPSVIRVSSFIKHHQKVPLTRANIFKRDNYECAYCPAGTYHNREDLTLDHIVPQAKGGKDTWENLITACRDCNSMKADLWLKEFTEKPIPEPRRPHYLMLMKSVQYIPKEWRPYLFF